MDFTWRKAAIADLIKYNKWLLVLVVVLTATCFALSLFLFSKEETMVIIPYSDINNKIQISNKKPHSTYLKPWAIEIAKEIFTTSPDEVEEQHSRMVGIATVSRKGLDAFF